MPKLPRPRRCLSLVGLATAGLLACGGQSPEPGEKSQSAVKPAAAEVNAQDENAAAPAKREGAKRPGKRTSPGMVKAAEGALALGAKAPSFTLPSDLGDAVSLASLIEKGAVVLVFYRGHW